MRGSNIPFISKTDLQELSVPVPSLAVQKQISELYQLGVYERGLLEDLAQHKKAFINAVCMRLAESSD